MKSRSILFGSLAVAAGVVVWGCAQMKQGDEQPVALEQTPAAVQSAIVKALGSQKPEKIVIENVDGKKVYEVTYHVNGQEHSAEFTPAGEMLEQEADVEVSSLPPAVSAAVLQKYPGAKIEEAADVTSGGQRFYEIGVKPSSGGAREMQINADGSIRADQAEKGD
jgi:hypothetical protein